jgi:hypothetical protein
MRASAFSLSLLALVAFAPAGRAMTFESLPPVLQKHLFDLAQACSRAGGRAGDAMKAIEGFDFDDDGTPDIILDEGRYPCRGAEPEAHCAPVGCYTIVTLSQGGRWKQAFDLVGSYCIDRDADPPRLVTIQRNFLTSGESTVLSVRYRFKKGMAFQEGRGRC